MNQNIKNTITIIVSLSITAALVGFCTVMAPKRDMFPMNQEQGDLQAQWENIDQLPEEEQIKLFDQMQEQMIKQMEAQYGQPVQRQEMTREEKLQTIQQLILMQKMSGAGGAENAGAAENTTLPSANVNSDQGQATSGQTPTNQGITVANGMINVVSPLVERKAILLKGVTLCSFPKPYSMEVRCDDTNSQCMTIIPMDEPIPASLTINRSHNGTCVQQTLDNLSQYYYPFEYVSEFTIDKATFNALNIPEEIWDEVEKTANSKFTRSIVSLVGADARSYSLQYRNNPVQQDELAIGSTLVKITFGQQPQAQAAQ